MGERRHRDGRDRISKEVVHGPSGRFVGLLHLREACEKEKDRGSVHDTRNEREKAGIRNKRNWDYAPCKRL